MEIFPAFDLLDGKCVRLQEGNFEASTTYFENPQSTLSWLEESGATRLHLVDLSGAQNSQNRQTALLFQLVSSTAMEIQIGGGIRTEDDVRDLLNLGVRRVVLGSIAVLSPELTCSILKEFGPDKITLALDIQKSSEGFKIATHGWKETSNQSISEFLEFYQKAGVSRILCTDIQRDGMLTGPNLLLYQSLASTYPKIEFQASGGVSSLQDLVELKKTGVHSVITGKALYERKFTLQEANLLC